MYVYPKKKCHMVIERNVLKNCLKKKRVSNSNKEIG